MTRHVDHWNGKPLDELTREELIDAVLALAEQLRAECSMAKAVEDLVLMRWKPVDAQ